MIIRALCVATLLILIVAQLSAQRDKVYLKNGSVLVGQLVSYKSGDTLIFHLKTGEEIILPQNSYLRLEMGTAKLEKIYAFREKGFYNASYFGLNFGKTSSLYGVSSNLLGVSMDNITGYQFNRLIGAGLGVGIADYYANSADLNVVSIYTELRGYMSKHVTSAYYSLSTGFGLPLKNKTDSNLGLNGYKGGFLFQPSIGIRLGASPHMNFFIDVGARFQRFHFNQINQWSENYYNITAQRWILRGGIMF